jgi:diguanylate cyclase (GGDEF)-like protein
MILRNRLICAVFFGLFLGVFTEKLRIGRNHFENLGAQASRNNRPNMGVEAMQTINGGLSISLDVSTLFVVATCVTALLGLFLLFAWKQDRIRALGWWGAAYLLGGFAVGLWAVQGYGSPFIPIGLPNAMLLVACGMMWSAARLFHGRNVLWLAMLAGPAAWLLAFAFPGFDESAPERIIFSSLIISTYVFLTASELWQERRKNLIRRWPALFVPILHGLVFLFPIPLASMLPKEHGLVSLASGWGAIFVLELMLYAVATAFMVLVLAKERVVHIHRTAASTDALTGLLNRRALCEGAQQLFSQQARKGEAVSVLIFDLDQFKSINDQFGHAIGDAALRRFAETITANMRATDLFGRLGGEEFAAVIPATLDEAVSIAERVRRAYEIDGQVVDGAQLGATVSVGAASGHPARGFDALLSRADAALYRAKADGRNRTETMEAGPSIGSGSFATPLLIGDRTPNLLPQARAA